MSQDQIDLVLAFEQPLPRRRVDREGFLQPEPIAHFAALEIDVHAVLLFALGAIEDQFDRRFGERHRQHAVADRVVAEDVGERRRDDDAEARVLQRPRRMLARRAAAEVHAGDEHRGALVALLVQDERRYRASSR